VLCSQDPDPALVGQGLAATGAGQQQQSAQGWQHVGLGRLWRQQQQVTLFVDEPAADVLHALRAAVAVLAADADGAPGAAVSADGDGQQQELEQDQQQERRAKLAVLGEYLVQWLLTPGRDLDSVRRVLQGTASAGQQHDAFGGIAKRVVETVQAQVEQRFGFVLAVKSVDFSHNRP
jgi:DNA primase